MVAARDGAQHIPPLEGDIEAAGAWLEVAFGAAPDADLEPVPDTATLECDDLPGRILPDTPAVEVNHQQA